MPVSPPQTPQPAAKANVYQIFYNEETWQALDPGLIPLDNTGQRPDWCEYWPIRNFLLGQPLNEGEFYGFLSPKFGDKTGLSARQVQAFAATTAAEVDVISFSPWFDHSALFQNVFEQGAHFHPEVAWAFRAGVDLAAPGTDLANLITDSRNAIFCNYFLARPAFWRHWLAKAEMIFALAEKDDTPLGQQLNAACTYGNVKSFPIKVFFIERLASLLLATERQWQTRFYEPLALSFDRFFYSGKALKDLLTLNVIKQQAADQQGEERQRLLQIWRQTRDAVARQHINTPCSGGSGEPG
ncbi:MAG: hypothetical protein LBE62_10920 [Azonexus sp.]|nr:hypothetical protein [Azonexus sp.]